MFIRWPAQADLRNQYMRDGLPRILVVEAGASPPVCNDPLEDWVRPPVGQDDVGARVRTLRSRLDSQQTPVLDSSGTLTFGMHAITVSNLQAELMELLTQHFREVVYRQEFTQRLAKHVERVTRNSLDLHIMRLRRRLSPTGLVIRTAWRRGYVLELDADASGQ